MAISRRLGLCRKLTGRLNCLGVKKRIEPFGGSCLEPLFYIVWSGQSHDWPYKGAAKSKTGTSTFLTGLNCSFANFNNSSVTSGE